VRALALSVVVLSACAMPSASQGGARFEAVAPFALTLPPEAPELAW
jgi:hypothetical protein